MDENNCKNSKSLFEVQEQNLIRMRKLKRAYLRKKIYNFCIIDAWIRNFNAKHSQLKTTFELKGNFTGRILHIFIYKIQNQIALCLSSFSIIINNFPYIFRLIKAGKFGMQPNHGFAIFYYVNLMFEPRESSDG